MDRTQEADGLMQDRQWKKASTLLEEVLEDKALEEEERKTAIYNLIVCYLKAKDPNKSQAAINKYGKLLDEGELKELQDEVYKLPTSIKSNEVKGLGWFRSEIRMKDIIGLKKVKQEVRERIILPIQHSTDYQGYRLREGDGFIFFGPPGTGKTLLAKAISGETGIRMLLANVHEMVSKYQGESTKNLHQLFEQARSGGPAVIFFDEIDSLAQSRNASNVSSTGGEDRRIIDTLLTELDGAQSSNKGLYVIGATNHPWDIDSAFTRSGRFSTFIYVPPPTTKERETMFRYYIRKLNAGNINYLKLALMTFGMTSADISDICDMAGNHAKGQMLERTDKQPFGNDGDASRQLNTRDFIWAIKKKGDGILLKEFDIALERLKAMPSSERGQYKELQKDVIYFHKRGVQMQRLFRIAALFV